LLGYLVGDRIKARRIERIAILWKKTRERLRETDPPSLKYAIPILQAAADEENEELQDLWSRLLAAAMDPNRQNSMRQSFIQAVKQLDPLDALVLKAIRDNGSGPWVPNGRSAVASKLNCSVDEVRVSFDHLAELGCIYFTDSTGARITPNLSSFGTLLMNVLSG
jgi:Abortive infection alpha